MPPLDEADGEVPQLARILRGKNDDRASPKRRNGGKTEAVIARALGWVLIELHFEFVLTLSRIATAINRVNADNWRPEEYRALRLSGAFQTATVLICGIRV
jgi:hypothetical protein